MASFTIRIEGLDRVRRMLGQDFGPTIRSAAFGIAAEIEHEVAPYPPTTIANSPSNPTGRWYERGYGPRWARKRGGVGGRKTSQVMGKQWYKQRTGQGAILGNRATYSGYLHSKAKQVRWAGPRGWVTDRQGIERVIQSGKAVKIILQAVLNKLR